MPNARHRARGGATPRRALRASPAIDGLPFAAQIVQVAGDSVVAVEGEIDMATAGALWETIERALSLGGRLVLDLERTTFIDSTGLAVLVRAYRHLGQLPEAIVVRSPSAAARRLLVISGVAPFITIEDDGVQARGARS